MPITLDPEAKQHVLASIKRFALKEFDLELGDLKAGSILDYFLRELAPSVYNRAIAGAQRYVQDRVADLEGACYEPEFGYWAPAPKGKRGR